MPGNEALLAAAAEDMIFEVFWRICSAGDDFVLLEEVIGEFRGGGGRGRARG